MLSMHLQDDNSEDEQKQLKKKDNCEGSKGEVNCVHSTHDTNTNINTNININTNTHVDSTNALNTAQHSTTQYTTEDDEVDEIFYSVVNKAYDTKLNNK